ncbi:MAG: metallopeptidase family protein [Planctomycetota bacterium]
MVSRRDRDEFDRLLDRQVDALPPALHELLAEVPLIVDDEPTADLLESLGMTPGDDDLCGLHDGTPLTERSVEAEPAVPDRMMLFRGPIMRLAGYSGVRYTAEAHARLTEEIRITLLHEIGHHFGLDEDDLERLGYA